MSYVTAEADLTIEQLAQATGMSVRNIRAHQSRGLLPPPEVRARVGFYGDEHVARLRLIQDLQADGFNLKSIERLLEDAPGAADRILGLKRIATEPFGAEAPELLTSAELRERFGDDVDAETFARAQRLGLLVALGEGRYEAPSPTLLRAAEELRRRGVPLPAAIAVSERLRAHCEAIARSFVELFLAEVWGPFEAAGHPSDRWQEVVETLESLTPLASQAVQATFAQTMTAEVEGAFGQQVERAAQRRR